MSTEGVPKFEAVWRRILNLEGETFHQIRGGAFTFERRGEGLELSRTNQRLAKSAVKEAFERAPFRSTTELRDLRGPSYLYAILMDDRVRQGEW
jgi:hypothetical protein